MSVLSPFFQKLFILPGITAIVAANIDTGEPLLSVGNLCDEKISKVSMANAKLLRLKMSMAADQHAQTVEDITVSLNDEYHLIYPILALQETAHNFLYVILKKNVTNLAYCRHKIQTLLDCLTQSEDETRLLEIEADYLMDKNDIRTKIKNAEGGRVSESGDDMPSFMRTEVALQLLGVEAIDVESFSK